MLINAFKVLYMVLYSTNDLYEHMKPHCRTCGCLRGKEERKSFAFQYFQYFNFKKLENPEPFVRSEAQAFKKTHK